jgi:glycosyltransferase involved in cell wall biosynthesis
VKISIIVPTLNEASALRSLLPGLMREGIEVLVVDGGSTDATLPVAREFPMKILQTRTGRAVQMNAGAQEATGDWLWFLHADTVLPPD